MSLQQEFDKLASRGKIRRDQVHPLVKLAMAVYVRHRTWGVGKIESISTQFSRMFVDFREKPHHGIDLSFAPQILQPASEADFLVQAKPQPVRLPWKLLPPGSCDVAAISSCLRAVENRNGRNHGFDPSRLEFLLGLRPGQVFMGSGDFDGYLALCFARFSGAVLENPLEGNAIYIFGANWRDLSKLSKADLFRKEGDQFIRIIHSGDWQTRLRLILGNGKL